jgi:hypothetical protein
MNYVLNLQLFEQEIDHLKVPAKPLYYGVTNVSISTPSYTVGSSARETAYICELLKKTHFAMVFIKISLYIPLFSFNCPW